MNQGITIGVIKKQNSGGGTPTLPDVFLGVLNDTTPFSDILDNFNLTVQAGTVPVLFTLGSQSRGSQSVASRYLWKLGAGNFNPIGSENYKSKLELIEETFLSSNNLTDLSHFSSFWRIFIIFSSVVLILISSRKIAIS